MELRRAACPLLLLLLLAGQCLGQYGAPEEEQEPAAAPTPSTIHIAGLFAPNETQEIMAFTAAVERVNMLRLLPGVTVEPVVHQLHSTDGFTVSKQVCDLAAKGVSAIIGPNHKELINIVSSIAETIGVPLLLTHYTPLKAPSRMLVNIAPDRRSLSLAVVALLEDMNWKSFTIVYEDDEALFRLQEVLKAHGPESSPITVRRLGEGPDYRPLLKEIRNSTETRIVLDVAPEKLMEIFRQGRQVGMMSVYISYLVTSLDAHGVDYEEIKRWKAASDDRVANVTGLRLLDTEGPDVQKSLQDWLYNWRQHSDHVTLDASEIKTTAALVNDAVYMFITALKRLNMTEPLIFEKELSCFGADPWEHGPRIVEYINSIYSNPDTAESGMTGLLHLNERNERTNFSLTLIDTVTNVGRGVWNMSGVHLFRSAEEMESDVKQMLRTGTLRVASKTGMPYLEEIADCPGVKGSNECVRGYSKDLIDAIAKHVGFKYEFYLVGDNNNGALQKNGKWNGIIGDLIDRQADLGICDMTITFDRENAVDFTMPFMTLGISILHTNPIPPETNRFSFLLPFSTEVWIYMAFAYVAVSCLLFALARVSPYEWDNPHLCDPNPEELENMFHLLNSMMFVLGSLLQQGCDFLPKVTPGEWESTTPNEETTADTILEYTLNLANAIWHNVGSLMQQGSDIAPKAASTRLVASMWWFFVLIMISSYTANLAAFLTDNLSGDTITDVKALAAQTKVAYGCMKNGATKSFFEKTNFSDYQRMFDVMQNAKPSVYVESNKAGVARVVNGKGTYAFLMESTGIEYEAARECTLRQVGGLLDSKGYGIALPRNSPYRGIISGAVLHLQESGALSQLKDLWWRQYDNGTGCLSDSKPAADSNKLGLPNVGGVFLVLIYGCVAAFFMAIIEFLWNTRTVAIDNKISVSEAFWKELKFAVNFSESTKPVRHTASTPSTSSSRSVRSGRSGGSSPSGSPSMARSTR